jgi:hypothetical protein
MLSIPSVLISNRHNIHLNNDAHSVLTALSDIESEPFINIASVCRRALGSFNASQMPVETVSNETFRIFDDYFGIVRSGMRPLEVYMYSALEGALLLVEDINSFPTSLSIDEQEKLLRGILEALAIGVDYLSIPIQCDRNEL